MDKHQSDKYKKMLKEAIEVDGLEFCISCLVEECAEFTVAVSHYRRGRCDITKVMEELADVVMMADVVRTGVDDEIGFQDYIKAKSERIGDRITFKKNKRNIESEVL